MRKPVIFGNWKMNKNNVETKAFFEAVDSYVHNDADFGIAAPFTVLNTAVENSENVLIAAQNMHFEESGAFTGEISADMLKELKVDWVVLGHSERRQYFNETDKDINKKAHVAVEKGMTPIICVGETLYEFEADKTEDVVRKQVSACLSGLEPEAVKNLVIAYEPVWAIGTGKSATVEIAQNTCALVRDEVRKMFGEDVAEAVRIQYGGSVKPNNIQEYLAEEDIDGALIGGASLQEDSFIEIIKAVKK